MKKRIVLSLFAIIFIALFLYSSSSCGPKHEHSYKWQTNEEKHWEKCDCGDIIEEDVHSFINEICSICNYQKGTEGLTFELNEEGTGYIISASRFEGESIVIPNTYQNLPVVGIADQAFEGCSSLTSIYIPTSIKSVGENIYSWSSNRIKDRNIYYEGNIRDWCNISFQSTVFASGLTSSDEGHFYLRNNANEWEEVTEIDIPADVNELSSFHFTNLPSIISVTIADDVKIEENRWILWNCKNIKKIKSSGFILSRCVLSRVEEVTITSGEIEDECFHSKDNNLGNLKIVTIEDGVTSIGVEAFEDCSGLTSITIPNSVISIGVGAFKNCRNLESITIPFIGEVLDLEGTLNRKLEYIFRTSTGGSVPSSLKEVIITGGFIGDSAFSGCSSIESIIMENGVTGIGASAFKNCSSLTSITIPDSVTNIGWDAFFGCNNLLYNSYFNGLYLGNEKNPYVVFVKPKSTDIHYIEIYSNTRHFLYDAFAGCDSLENVYYVGTIEDWCKIRFQRAGNIQDNLSTPMAYASHFYLRNSTNEWEEVTSIGH
ncbi:leucine-rich repeat protein [bacterium]|nr:leucine-rich repeat protein [bacterium]